MDRWREKAASDAKNFTLWVGWAVPMEWWTAYSTASDRTSLALGISLLSPADGQWPLDAASRAAANTSNGENVFGVFGENSGDGQGGDSGEPLCRALNASDTLKTQLAAVAGPLVAVEPQLVFVFGDFPTMAGFPSWTTRNAEFFEAGCLLHSDKRRFDAILRRYMKVRQRFGK